MRNLKKFLALVLAMMMTLSLMVTVNAANVEFEDGETITDAFLEDITVLAGMGVFEGYGDGTFKPTDTVTRAEMAAIVYRLVTGDAEGTSDALHGQYGSFKDVSDDKWYAGYVGYCANAGLILGYGDGTFRPSNKVTGYEALVMVLRAMGYDQPTEFSKSDWRTHAASIATQRGLLSKINATRYKGTLSQPALREVVGEIVFQAANQPMVEWTAAFGYQTTHYSAAAETGEQRVLNDTLGQLYYGLESTTRIVLGNQMTGESCTVLGAEKDGTISYETAANKLSVSYTMYDYPGVELVNVAAGVKAGTGNADEDPTVPAKTKNIVILPKSMGLNLDFDTDLDYFGHKVTAWYNADDTSAAKQTYALFDKAEMAEYVTVNENGTSADATNQLSIAAGTTAITAANRPTLGIAAKEAGFNVDIGGTKASGGTGNTGSTAYFSNQYDRINDPTAAGVLPGKGVEMGATTSPIRMYYVVSNNAAKKVDVVVNLDADVAKITERNTTATVKTLTLGKAAETQVPDIGMDAAGTGTGQIIALDKVLPGSTQTLNSDVTAWLVKGTTKPGTASEVYGETTVVLTARTDYFYFLAAPFATTTGTVSTYHYQDAAGTALDIPLCTISLTDGTVLKQSGMWDQVAESTSFYKVFGTDDLKVGVTYTFYLDRTGRFVGWGAPSGYTFLYNTFADYGVGELGTGTIGYAVTGVDWDGNIVKNHALTSLTLPITTGDINTPTAYEWDRFGTSTNMDFPGKANVDADGNTVTAPDRPLSLGYNSLPTTKKDLGNGSSTVTGNQIQAGMNTGFMLNEAGDMDYRVPAPNGIQFLGYKSGDVVGTQTADTWTWTITKDDADRGFIRVYNNDDPAAADTQRAYLMDNNTKFIVVTGSGTADLKVDTYTGLKELVGAGTEAVISVENAAGTAFGANADQVWFKTNVDHFGTVYTDDNATINTVILSNTNLSRYNAQSLFYSSRTAATGVTLPSAGSDVKQYRLWNNGEEGTYFIDESKSTKTDGTAWTADTIEDDDFFTLTPVDEVNGVIVYKATGKNPAASISYTDTNKCNVGVTYKYLVVNNLSTGELTKTATLPFSVSDAIVCDVEWLDAQADGNAAITSARSQITNIEELHHAVSVKQADGTTLEYTITVAITNDGSNVTCIYIDSVAT